MKKQTEKELNSNKLYKLREMRRKKRKKGRRRGEGEEERKRGNETVTEER